MRACSPGDLEAYLDGELAPESEPALRAHLAGCASCASELAWLRAERRAFVTRANVDESSPPPFEDVLRRARASASFATASTLRPGSGTTSTACAPMPLRRARRRSAAWRSAFVRAIPFASAAAVALTLLAATGARKPLTVTRAPEASSVLIEAEEVGSPTMSCLSDEANTAAAIDVDEATRASTSPIGAVAATNVKRAAAESEDAYGACFMPSAVHDDASALCIAPQL